MIVNGTIYNTKPNPTVRYRVSDYLAAMHKAYTENYREQRLTLGDQREAEKVRWEKETQRGWNSTRQQHEDQKKHDQVMKNFSREIDELSRAAKADLDEILSEADKRFEKRARPTPDTLDLAAVELIKGDVLSVSELAKLADDYADNLSMSRIIGKYASDKQDQSVNDPKKFIEWGELLTKTKQAEFDYRTPLESYMKTVKHALADDANREIYVPRAKAWDQSIMETYDEKIAEYDNMYIAEDWNG